MTGAPTLRGRLVARELRALREAAGLSRDQVAEQAGLDSCRFERLEDGVVPFALPDLFACAVVLGAPSVELLVEHAANAHVPGLQCPWGHATDAVLDVLCRAANRIEMLSPSRMPDLPPLDALKCTAYVREAVAVARADLDLRVIGRDAGAYPGVGCPMTLFRLPAGPDVVFHPYLHASSFSEDPRECAAARDVFDRLPAYL